MFKQSCVQTVVPLFIYRKTSIYAVYKLGTAGGGGLHCVRPLLP